MWFIQHTSFDEQLLYSYFADNNRTYGWIKKPRMNDPVRVWIGPLLVEMLACMHISSLSCFSKCYVFLVHIIFLLHILPFSQNIYYLFLVYITLFLCILPFPCTYYLFLVHITFFLYILPFTSSMIFSMSVITFTILLWTGSFSTSCSSLVFSAFQIKSMSFYKRTVCFCFTKTKVRYLIK